MKLGQMKRSKIKCYVYPAQVFYLVTARILMRAQQNFYFFVVSKRSYGLPHDGNTNASDLLPPPPPPPPMDIALQHGCRNVTCSISLHLDLLFLISALLHEKTGCHALWGGVEDGRKHATSYLTNDSPKLTKTCQTQPSKGLGSRLSSTLLIIYINISCFK